MQTHFTAAELADFKAPGLPKSVRRMQMRAAEEKWQGQVRPGTSRLIEYPLSVLPAEAQAHIRGLLEAASQAAHDSAAALGVPLRTLELTATNALAAARSDELRQALEVQERGITAARGLPSRAKARMDAKMEILSLFSIYWKTHVPPIGKTAARFAFEVAYNDYRIDVPPYVRGLYPALGSGTLARWMEVQAKEGIAALGGKHKGRAGQSLIDTQPAVKEFILGLIVNAPHVRETHVHAGLRARFRREPDVKLPSLRALQRWISAWKAQNQNVYTAMTDPDAWRNRFMTGFGSASEDVVRLNQRWELDSSPADLILADGRRHALLAVIDVYSRRLKLYVSTTSKATAVAAVLRRALLDWGAPEVCKTDNGSDYISKHMQLVFGALAIRHDRCPPRQPWHKPHVEAVFHTFQHSFVELLPGFIGHDVDQRKMIEARNAITNFMRYDQAVNLDFLSAEELQAYCDQWCEAYYHHQKHSKLGQTPWEVAAAWPLPVKLIENERALDILLAEVPGGDGRRVVGKKGIRVDGYTFVAAELEAYVNQPVFLRYDPQDMGRLIVSSATDDQHICIAECPELTGASRAEVAAKARALAQERLKAEKAALRAAAKRIRPDEVVAEILTDAAEAAGKLTRMYAPSETHETPGLVAAARAVEAMEHQPEPADEVDPEAHLATIHQFEARRKEVAPRDDDELVPWNEALDLERELAAKGDLPSKKMARLEFLREQPWYTGVIPTLEMLGLRPATNYASS